MLRTTKTAVLAALMLAAVSTQAAAQDQEAGDIRVDLPARKAAPRDQPHVRTRRQVGDVGPLRFYGGFHVAVGGEVQIDRSFWNGLDADPTVGIQMGADYVLHDYFSLGGEMRFLWFKPDGWDDRTFMWDLVLKPRGRYAFHDIPLELYGTLPIGLTVPADIDLPGQVDAESKVGFTVGLLAGANWFFTQHLGVNAEIGWQFHKIRAEQPGWDSHLKLNQFVLLCPNFIYAL
jgi:hypothetical protein